VLDVEERKARILEGCKTLCFARNLELVEDLGLLDEVAGLAEWPTPVLGDMDPAFLDLPAEVIRTSMRTHQKYFAVRKPDGEGLAPHFITIANVQAADGGAVIAAGNAKVLSSRLSDARFFWDEDVKVGFEPWLEKLNGVTFHAKLGTMAERVERIVALAREIAPLVGADPDKRRKPRALPRLIFLADGRRVPRTAGPDGRLLRPRRRPGPRDRRRHPRPLQTAGAVGCRSDRAAERGRGAGGQAGYPGGLLRDRREADGLEGPFALRRAALGVIRTILENRPGFPWWIYSKIIGTW
jgi:glycyl-tRNA synthetase beta chain